MSGSAPPPARGALAGVKADVRAAQEGSTSYNPVGVGSAWSHNFLNQKPWHPLNFRNQMRRWEAEQKQVHDEKERQRGLAEFNAEQEHMKTVSYLSPEEQKRYQERQSVSFMYAKPPGLDAALAKEQKQQQQPQQELQQQQQQQENKQHGPSTSTPGEVFTAGLRGTKGYAPPALDPDKLREDPFSAMLVARQALQNHERFHFKHFTKHSSPSRGGIDASAPNQQLLADAGDGDNDDGGGCMDDQPNDERQVEALLSSLGKRDRKRVLKAISKQRRKREKELKIKSAEAVLKAAGYDVDKLLSTEEKKKSKDRKRKSRHRA